MDSSTPSAAHPRYWPTWLGLGLLRLLALLPLPLLALLGAGLGMIVFAVYPPRRRIVRTNIQLCFPELSGQAQRHLVRRHYRAFGQTMLDVAIAWWGSPRRLRRLVHLHGEHHLDAARAAGRNVILLVPHFVGLEIGGLRLSLREPMLDIFRHPRSRPLSLVMQRQRSRFGAILVEYNEPLTRLVRAIKAGTPLHYLPDQDQGRRKSVFAPFFGIPTATLPTLSRLAHISNALVIPCVTYQLPWGRGYETTLQPPLENFPTDDALADAARMNAVIEAAVRRCPEQYFWMHRRFKTRPQRGEPKLYGKRRKR